MRADELRAMRAAASWFRFGAMTAAVRLRLALSFALAMAAAAELPATETAARVELSVDWKVLANRGAHFDAELTLSNAGPDALPASGWRVYFNAARKLTLDGPQGEVMLRHVNGDFFELSPGKQFSPLGAGAERTFQLKGAHWAIKESDAPAGFYLTWLDGDGRVQGAVQPLHTTIAPFVAPQQTARSPGDNWPVPTAATRYDGNPPLELLALAASDMVTPAPVSAVAQPGEVRIDASTIVACSPGAEPAAAFLASCLRKDIGVVVRIAEDQAPGPRVIRLLVAADDTAGASAGKGSEAYSLEVNERTGINITGQGAAGVFYGVQTLRALLPVEAYRSRPGLARLDGVEINDSPRFAYRGLHLDVARNFHGVATVKKLLDLMAFYKLNRLHWHLTDDEGWRIEINAYPELTAIGGRRGHTSDESDRLVPSFGSGPTADPAVSTGCGHYTQDEVVDILRYAQARHIEVIPELDFPGHARAAIKSLSARSARLRRAGDVRGAESCLLVDPLDKSTYESVQLWRDNVVDVGLDSTYQVLETIIDEVIDMYRVAGAPLTMIHIGGDEVPEGAWQKSPACQRLVRTGAVPDLQRRTLHAYFVKRMAELLSRRGLNTGCWEECVLIDEVQDGKTVKKPSPALLNENIVAYVWNNVWGWGQEDVAYQLANAGYDVVLCNATNLYFDLAYDKDPAEPGYYWAAFVDERQPFEFVPLDIYKNACTDAMGHPIDASSLAPCARLTESGVSHILGLQGQLWSETLSSRERLEYAAFPKVISLAERAWAAEPAWSAIGDPLVRQAALANAWRLFANRLGQRELPRLDFLAGGVNYRVPPASGKIVDGRLHANVAYPGLDLRYEDNGGDPSLDSPHYSQPTAVRGVVKLRAFSPAGRASRTTTVRP